MATSRNDIYSGEIKWFKVTTNIFDHEKIMCIETLPEGDALIVIWFKLLCLAAKANADGALMIAEDVPYTDDMLAAVFRRPIAIVRLALKTFEKFKMIELHNDIMRVANWEKYQNIDGMDRIREQTRLRTIAYRERKRLNAPKCDVTSDATVTHCDALDIDTEKDISIVEQTDLFPADEQKGKPVNRRKQAREQARDHRVEVQEIVAYLNLRAGTEYKPSGQATSKAIAARINEGYTVDDFKRVIDVKCLDWLGTEYAEYLRPSTLFGNKFEDYLNASKVKVRKGGRTQPPADDRPFVN